MARPTASCRLQGALIGVAAAIAAGVLQTAGALDWMERPMQDWRTRLLAAPGRATDQVCTILIDQNSLDEARDRFGIGWPWPRQVYAHLLDFCKRAGARSVTFDLIFTESSASGVLDDEQFGDAIARGVPFVVALPMSRTPGAEPRWPDSAPDPLPPADAIPGITENRHAGASLPQASFPIPEIAGPAALLGNVAADPDRDAVFRRVPPFRLYANRFVPLLGLAPALAVQTNRDIRLEPDALVIGNRRIPLDRQGQALLRFRGPTQTHAAYNAFAILQSEMRLQEGGEPPIVTPAALKNRHVLVGVSAPGLMDLKPTPVGRTYPGVEVHATFLDNFLSDDFLREPHPASTVLLGLLAAILAGAGVRAASRIRITVAAFAIFPLLPLAAGLALYPGGIQLPVAGAVSAVLLAMTAAVIVNYAVEGRQKRFIKGAFKQYLSPVVIEKLMANPGQLTLGGEEKTLSILFSDVQGFTAISESLSPSALTALLNTYLTAMTDIIHASGGTIDKYEGDAIIAFWNAPLDQPDHAARAVQAALECQQRLAAMRPDLQARYGHALFVRIGINTGPVVVGNMGSTQRFDYTFLGDAGNLAARLEGINKRFGTYLLISENTLTAAGPVFHAREISRVRVVGKSKPITIFEPLPAETAKTRNASLDAFHSALNAYYSGAFGDAETRFAGLAGEDPVAAVYARRCAALAAEPPPDWDGIWTLTEK